MKARYFKIYELVSPKVYDAFGEKAWRFIDPTLIKIIDFLRDVFGQPITVNDWKWGGTFTQRGLRENICDIVAAKTIENQLYLSAHIFGKAIDFHIKGYTSQQVRAKIELIRKTLPHPIRVERNTDGWVHIDIMTDKNNTNLIQYF